MKRPSCKKHWINIYEEYKIVKRIKLRIALLFRYMILAEFLIFKLLTMKEWEGNEFSWEAGSSPSPYNEGVLGYWCWGDGIICPNCDLNYYWLLGVCFFWPRLWNCQCFPLTRDSSVLFLVFFFVFFFFKLLAGCSSPVSWSKSSLTLCFSHSFKKKKKFF